MTDRLEVITAGLLVAQVGVQGGITSSSGQVFSLAEGNMFALRVLVALGESKVNDVDVVLGGLGRPNQEIVGFDVSVDDALVVDPLDPLKHLNRDVADCFEVKFAAALLEEVLERLAQQVHNHDVVHFAVVGFFIANEVEEGHEGFAAQFVNQFRFPEQHDMPLHFHCFLHFGR